MTIFTENVTKPEVNLENIEFGWLEYSKNLLMPGHLSIRIYTYIQNKQFSTEILAKIKLEIKQPCSWATSMICSNRKEKQNIKVKLSGPFHSRKVILCILLYRQMFWKSLFYCDKFTYSEVSCSKIQSKHTSLRNVIKKRYCLAFY